MKKINLMIAALALFVLMAGPAAAEMYVEGYLGTNFGVTSPNPLQLSVNPAFKGPTKVSLEYPRIFSPYFMGGCKLGIWFSREGFPRVDFPDWMKYLGFYLDFSYHGLSFRGIVGSRRMYITPSPPPAFFQMYKFTGDASIATLGFMFAFRYGFGSTEKVPFGRWQPYVAVGPAIIITTLRPTFKTQPNANYELFPVETDGTFEARLINPPFDTEHFIDYQSSNKSTVSLGLAAELGMRFMITKFLSLDTSVKYRYARPSTTYDFEIYGFTHQMRFAPQLNLFSIQAGVAYHF